VGSIPSFPVCFFLLLFEVRSLIHAFNYSTTNFLKNFYLRKEKNLYKKYSFKLKHFISYLFLDFFLLFLIKFVTTTFNFKEARINLRVQQFKNKNYTLLTNSKKNKTAYAGLFFI
jgi:hypothetical protein